MAKYKDYPIYTYDEPATYSDFSGGINTDPSNEHLQPNEMRDCLNMHFKSAALVKRKGASLLCNIECEDELITIQGVFLFTYRVTYIIIAADGKLYKGFYSPNATIRLSRLPISIEIPESLKAFNPENIAEGLTSNITENISNKHDGFIYSYISEDGKKVSLDGYIYVKDAGNIVFDNNNNPLIRGDLYVGEYLNLTDGSTILDEQIVRYDGRYFKLNWTVPTDPQESRYITRTVITPEYSEHWMPLSQYNDQFKNEILQQIDLLSTHPYVKSGVFSGLSFDDIEKVWKEDGRNINGVWHYTGRPVTWGERYIPWEKGMSVTYNGTTYVCIKSHTNYISPPSESTASTSAEWIKLEEKRELIFQNHSPIEAATYNNKMYITTGTRFIVIELVSNELVAHTVTPHSCNTTEITNIGYNYLSPYPELCRSTQYDQAITSIGGVLAIKNIYGRYTLTPQMNFAQGESEHDYYFKWEKKIGDEWFTIHSYKDNTYEDHTYSYEKDMSGLYALDENNEYVLYTDSMGAVQRFSKYSSGYKVVKNNLFTIEVEDADKYQYRVSFAKSFERTPEIKENWDYNKSIYYRDAIVSITNENGSIELYKCVKEHCPAQVLWDNIEYEKTKIAPAMNRTGYYYETYKVDSNGNYVIKTGTPVFSPNTSTKTGIALYEKIQKENSDDVEEYKFICYDTSTIIPAYTYWEKIHIEEAVLTEDGIKYDWVVDKVDGEYFGQGSSILAQTLSVEDTFLKIQSCKKITSDGNKFLLYDDKYNSGSWYKTIINNPTYITDRGGLSFKTNKNESLIKVISFNGNLIAFANAENVGGSIHMVTGNGDDWDDQSGYYSPYRRSTINVTVSCDNANTVQVCENILVFKYFDTLYYISGSELNNEVVSVYSCNDRIKHNNNFVRIPWEDNSCISEVTEDYYALLWKEKYIIEGDDLILDRPAIRIKMYYKLGTQQNEKIIYPWLKDESEYFNIDHIVYIKGKPIYLYNNTLTTFHNEVYTDYDKVYKCQVHFRGEDLNYPKMSKLINNVLVYYHRNQYSTIDFDLLVKNEAGHSLIDTASKRRSIQDLRALREGDTVTDNEIRLDSTILDSKVFNTTYKFPLLLADTIITAENDKEFSISSITYNYVTSETPDTTPYDLYTNILRPNETRESLGALLKQSVLETKVTKTEEIQKAIKGIKLTTETKDGKAQMQTALEINIGGRVDYLPLALFVYDKEAKALRLNTKKEDK